MLHIQRQVNVYVIHNTQRPRCLSSVFSYSDTFVLENTLVCTFDSRSRDTAQKTFSHILLRSTISVWVKPVSPYFGWWKIRLFLKVACSTPAVKILTHLGSRMTLTEQLYLRHSNESKTIIISLISSFQLGKIVPIWRNQYLKPYNRNGWNPVSARTERSFWR